MLSSSGLVILRYKLKTQVWGFGMDCYNGGNTELDTSKSPVSFLLRTQHTYNTEVPIFVRVLHCKMQASKSVEQLLEEALKDGLCLTALWGQRALMEDGKKKY